jgi:hypothetical protein
LGTGSLRIAKNSEPKRCLVVCEIDIGSLQKKESHLIQKSNQKEWQQTQFIQNYYFGISREQNESEKQTKKFDLVRPENRLVLFSWVGCVSFFSQWKQYQLKGFHRSKFEFFLIHSFWIQKGNMSDTLLLLMTMIMTERNKIKQKFTYFTRIYIERLK